MNNFYPKSTINNFFSQYDQKKLFTMTCICMIGALHFSYSTSHLNYMHFLRTCKTYPGRVVPYFSTLSFSFHFLFSPCEFKFKNYHAFLLCRRKIQILVCSILTIFWVSFFLQNNFCFFLLTFFNTNTSFQKLQWKSRSTSLYSCSKGIASDKSWYMSSIRRESRHELCPNIKVPIKVAKSLKIKKKIKILKIKYLKC